MYKGPSKNKSDSDDDRDKDYELVMDESIDTGSDMGEEESLESGEIPRVAQRPTVGELTIPRYQPRPVSEGSESLSSSVESLQCIEQPVSVASNLNVESYPSEKEKQLAYRKFQNEFIDLLKAGLKTKWRMGGVLSFLQAKDCTYLNFNAMLNGETLFVHLIKGLCAHRKNDVELAKEILQYIFTHASLEKINWNAVFKDDNSPGKTALAWLLHYALTNRESDWVKEVFSKIFSFRDSTSAPDWILKLNWDAKNFTGQNSGRTCLWWILSYANRDDFFAKSLLEYLIKADILKKLGWDAKNSFNESDMQVGTSCLGLLAIYLIRNPEHAPVLILSESRIPLEKFDPKGIKWEQLFFYSKTNTSLSLLSRYIKLAMLNTRWAQAFLDKMLNRLPTNYIDRKIMWNEEVTEGSLSGKNTITLLLCLAIQGHTFAQKIIHELPQDIFQRFPLKPLDSVTFTSLLNQALLERQAFAVKILNLIFAMTPFTIWQSVNWTVPLLQSFTEGILSEDFGNPSAFPNVLSATQMWSQLNWDVVVARGVYKVQPMLQWLIEEAVEGNLFAQKVLGELNHEALNWKKVNFKVIAKKGEYKNKPLNVAIFEIFQSKRDALYASKTILSMAKAVSFATLSWDTLNYNLALPHLGQGRSTIIAALLTRELHQPKHDQCIIRLLPVQPAAWKGVLWNMKAASGPYKDKTLWASLLIKAAQGEVWESQVVSSALTEIAVQHFSWDEIDLNATITAGSYKNKSLLEWLIIEAMQGETWAQHVVFSVNLSKFDWSAIDWNQKLTKEMYHGQTLLSSFIHHFLDRMPQDSHPLMHVLTMTPPAKLNFNSVSWEQKLTTKQHSQLFALTKIADNSVIAQKVMEGMVREVPLQQFNWNETVETENEIASPIWQVATSVQRMQNWANQTLERILEQLPINTIAWQKQYSKNPQLISSSLEEALPEPYLSQVQFLLKLQQAKSLLGDKSQKEKLERLLESLDVMALSAQNRNPKVMSLLAKFYKEMNDFNRYTQWATQIPKNNFYYEEARVELANATLERITQGGEEAELAKSVDFILDLVFSLSEEKSHLIRQRLTHFIRERSSQISEADELFLNSFKYDKRSFLEILARMKTAANSELISKLQGEIKRAHEQKQQAEKEKTTLQREKTKFEDLHTALIEQSSALYDVNQTLSAEKSDLQRQLEVLQEKTKALEEQCHKDAEEKANLKRQADDFEKQFKKAIEEKIDATIEAAKYQSLLNVERGKAELQNSAFVKEIDKIKKAYSPAPVTIESAPKTVTFSYAQQTQQQGLEKSDEPSEHSVPPRKRFKPQAGSDATPSLDDLL